MFDIGWSELLLIGAVALIVVGPKDLPKLMRSVAQWVRAARRMAGEFQRHVDDLMRESELDELRREVNALRNPVGTILNPGSATPAPKPAEPPKNDAAVEPPKPAETKPETGP